MVRDEGLREGASDVEVEEYLRRLCSDVTLCSPREGFFSHYVQQINEQVSDDFLTKFGKLTSDEERLQTTWGVKPIHTLKVQRFFKEKSLEASEARRGDGNKVFQEKKYHQALVYYSQAVMRAPHDGGESLALAYGNRSAVLYHLGHYHLALTDIDLAIEAGYPPSLTYKVLDRRGQCYIQQGVYSQAQEAFRMAAESLPKASMDDKKREAWKRDLDRKMDGCVGKEDKAVHASSRSVSGGAKLFAGPSPALPNASSVVEIKHTHDQGRYAVVTGPVPTGEVLMAERPYAAILMDTKSGTNCTHCYTRLVAPVPCPTCSGVAFCSASCRDKGLSTYHRWECQFLDLLKGSGVSLNAYLALRMITQHGLSFFKELRPSLRASPSLPSARQPHRPSHYLSLYHLAGLQQQRAPQDFFHRSLLASFLLKILQRAHFFGPWDDEGPPDKGLGEDEVYIGGLLLRHLQVVQFNAHELTGMSFAEGANNFKHTKSVYIGLAIYPTVAFCNHSCFPAVTRYFEGDRMVIVSLRPLAPGDVVAENYGPIFTHHDRQQRQRKLLSRYWFRCGCEACKEDWPMYDNMVDRRVLRCQTCRAQLPPRTHNNQSNVKCVECAASNNVVMMMKTLDQLDKLYVLGCRQMDEGKREEAIQCFIRYVDGVSVLLVPPYRELHLAMQSLRLLVAARGTIHALPSQK